MAVSLRAALQAHRQLRLEAERRALTHLEAIGDVGACPAGSGDGSRRRLLRAAGRVEREPLAIEVDPHIAQIQRESLQDRRQRIGDRVQLGGRRVDVDRGAHRHVAEVEGPGHRRGDDRHAQRGAFVGAGQVGLSCSHVEGIARARSRDHGADLAVGRTGGRGQLPRARARRRRDRRQDGVGAVGDAGEFAGQPQRRVDRDPGELRCARVAGHLQRKGGEGAGDRVGRAGAEARCELARRVTVLVDGELTGAVDRGIAGPRGQLVVDIVGAALGRSGNHAAIALLEVQLEVAERLLRVVVEGGDDPARVGVEAEAPPDLDRHPLAFGDHVAGEQRVERVVILLRHVEAGFERVAQHRRGDRAEADLGGVGTGWVVGVEAQRALGDEADFSLRAGAEPIGGRGVEANPLRQGDHRFLQMGGGGAVGIDQPVLGDLQVEIDATGRAGVGGRRLQRKGWVEGNASATGDVGDRRRRRGGGKALVIAGLETDFLRAATRGIGHERGWSQAARHRRAAEASTEDRVAGAEAFGCHGSNRSGRPRAWSGCRLSESRTVGH